MKLQDPVLHDPAFKPHSCLQDMTTEDFALPSLGSKLVALRDQVVHGTGFVLLRGLPVGQWSQDETATAYWGIGRHWGNPQSQNRLHHLLGHVKVREAPTLPSADVQLWCCCLCCSTCIAVQPCASCGTCAAGLLAPADLLVACCTTAEVWLLGTAYFLPPTFCQHTRSSACLLTCNVGLLLKDIKPPGGFKNPVNRVYATHGAQPYHTDSSDMVGE